MAARPAGFFVPGEFFIVTAFSTQQLEEPVTLAPLNRTLVALLAVFALCAHAAEQSKSGTPRKPTSVTFHKAPSEESPAAREKRLKRECKGRVNAGMCLGYAN